MALPQWSLKFSGGVIGGTYHPDSYSDSQSMNYGLNKKGSKGTASILFHYPILLPLSPSKRVISLSFLVDGDSIDATHAALLTAMSGSGPGSPYGEYYPAGEYWKFHTAVIGGQKLKVMIESVKLERTHVKWTTTGKCVRGKFTISLVEIRFTGQK